jgi:phosphate transport system permease protein
MPPRRRHRETHPADRFFKRGLRLLAVLVIVLFGMMVYQLFVAARPALKTFGLSFYWTSDWDPVNESYGALSFIWGTLVTSLLALCLAVPVSLGTALFLTELAPRWLRKPVGFLVEMLAAIPSVVYGIWGVFTLAPFVRTYIQPALGNTLGFLPFFKGPPFGIGIFSAGIILAIMIIPTITSIAREVFRSVPEILREGALALGATRWETIRIAVLRTAISGIVGAVVLGLGRAVGETMAVAMVIGNRAEISLSLFKPGATLASVIANEYAEASSDLHLSSLTAVGLGLFFVSFLVNSIARSIVWRVESRRGGNSR